MGKENSESIKNESKPPLKSLHELREIISEIDKPENQKFKEILMDDLVQAKLLEREWKDSFHSNIPSMQEHIFAKLARLQTPNIEILDCISAFFLLLGISEIFARVWLFALKELMFA